MVIPETTLWGGVIGVLGTVIGIFVGSFVTGIQNWLKEKREVGRIASILHQELFDQAQAVALSANFANAYNFVNFDRKRPRMERFGFEVDLPADPLVYRSLASHLYRLGPSAGTLVACYTAIEEAKKLTLALPEKASRRHDPTLKVDFKENHVIRAWIRASALTADALEEVGSLAEGPTGPDGPDAVSNLCKNLRNLVDGHGFHDNPIDPPEVKTNEARLTRVFFG